MKNKRNPIGFVNADGGTGRVAPIVREKIFGDFPTIDVPMTVQDRIATKDACIERAGEVFLSCGTGFKNSTASDTPELKKLGMESANIVMRPMLGAYAAFRFLRGPGEYKKPCGNLRYLHGGIYNEQSCNIKNIDGVNTAIIVQHMNVDDLVPFSLLATELAKEFDLKLLLSSKSSIAPSEQLFRSTVEELWTKIGIDWSEAVHKLTDTALAELPIKIASSMHDEGGFLHVTDNVNGDNSSNIIDSQHGNYVMTSKIYCLKKNGQPFTYFELAGGTADIFATGPLYGKTFFSPFGLIVGMADAFEVVNPGYVDFFDKVRKSAVNYIATVPAEHRDTEEMILMASRV